MHPNRRRKKRPNYGIRTVEIMRGPNGFGFTISGQQPCILSCIVNNSPADQAGLRAGDFLISVNGISVSKITHDAVVNLIGNCVGVIKMTIAENYYSDSSDEDLDFSRIVNARKPKYMHKGRGGRANNKREVKVNENEDQVGPIEYKALVGYLGTIEMPKQLLPNSRLQTVCSCIRKLRQEKRAPTDVLMTILPTCLTLKNSSNHILAIYPTNRVVYISSTADKESRYFGLVTSAVCDTRCNLDDISNSCHVFVSDPKIVDHCLHAKKAETFKINCTTDVITGYCLEFPKNALSIVSLVQTMYRLQDPQPQIEDGGLEMANSPQPSASSNSDSGIGFRDDCGNISDRIVVVEFPAPRSFPMPNNKSLDMPLNNVRANAKQISPNSSEKHNLNNIRAYENVSIKNAIEKTEYVDRNDYLVKQNNTSNAKRLAVRAMPYSERPVDVAKSHESDLSDTTDNVSLHSSRSIDFNAFKTPKSLSRHRKPLKNQLKLVSSCDNLAPEAFKLSPKVYGVSKPNRSCEGLSNLDEKCGYGSLQNLCSWNGKYERRCLTVSEPDVRLQGGRKCGFMCEKNGEVKCNSTEGPAGWAASFEKLLEDPLGLHTFAEFLKKEFSAENIYFWTACERYKRLAAGPERLAEARRIYEQHLCVGAPEPVNVDSQGRQCAEQSLEDADQVLFDQVQKQIFNLMKFDSYPRFLKSDLYKQCASGNVTGSQLDASLLVQPPATPSRLKKSLSNAEDRRRKSLLPWHRKNRSKSKDRGESDYVGRKTEAVFEEGRTNDVHGSKSSLTSLDLAAAMQENLRGSQDELSACRTPLCRVILNNGTTTIVQIRQSENVHQFIGRLLEKRGLTYSAFEVYTDKHHKALDVNEPSMNLAGCEVTVEQRVVFKLDLPNRKIIAVKSKYTKILVDVMRPILHKYNYSLEQVKITTREGENVNIHLPVTSVDGLRLNVQLLKDAEKRELKHSPHKLTHTLEEITNRVYEDILQGKADAACSKAKSDKGSVKSEDWGSEHSSGIFGRFLRTNSAMHERKKKSEPIRKEEGPTEQGSACKKPLIAKLKAGVKLQVACSESEELYEGLSRAQRSRLEDQRGTEINFELPDFLKDKENERKNSFSNRAQPETANDNLSTQQSLSKNIPLSYENVVINNELSLRSKLNNLRSNGESSGSNQSTPSKNGSFDRTVIENKVARSCGAPPPLPPKPKVLPAKPSNWGQPPAYFKVPNVPGKRTLYLEPSTSSFV